MITMLLWGGSWPVTKVLVGSVPPLTVGFFRFLIASIFFIPTLNLAKGGYNYKYSKNQFLWFFILGMTGIFGYGIFFLYGLKHTTAAQGSIIAGVNPAFISIFAHILHGERLKEKWMYSGFIISFIGVLFVIGVQSLLKFNREHLIGNLLIVCAMVCWSVYSNIGKHVMKNHSALEATTGAVFFGTILFAFGSATEEFWNLGSDTLDFSFWIAILYLGAIVTFLGFRFYFSAVKNIGATNSSIFINLVPIFGTFFSFVFLEETIYWTFLIGLVLIVFGIILINFPYSQNQTT
ncbi:MAG: DMT family transporter [Candidatus Kariarchaeaceae archaeon]